jgi:hypothetical protein
MNPSVTARTHDITLGVLEAEAKATTDRELRIIAENVEREKAIILEMLAPQVGVVSVAEIEALQTMLDENPALFCELFARMRRQLHRDASKIQGLMGLEERITSLEAWQARSEETLNHLRAWSPV